MSLPLVLTPTARTEYAEAFDHYDAIRPGLAADFEAAADAAFALVAAHPRIGREVAPGLRRVVLRKFPYSVFYRESAAGVEIIRVFHTSRNPADWQADT